MILLSIKRFRKPSLSILATSSLSSVKRSSHFVMLQGMADEEREWQQDEGTDQEDDPSLKAIYAKWKI